MFALFREEREKKEVKLLFVAEVLIAHHHPFCCGLYDEGIDKYQEEKQD